MRAAIEIEVIRALARQGCVVIACGSGGIAVIEDETVRECR
jgi:carbamate kinase